jgi:hypothetical protein
MATYPSDQFDNLPDDLDRVGAHRGPKVRGRGWIAFAWAVLATVVLVVAGLFALQTIQGGGFSSGAGPSDTPSATPTPTISPITDPTTIAGRHITITVLNGTATAGLATKASAALKGVHWNVTSTANASTSTFKKTVIYYSLAANKDVALGVAKALGFSTVSLTDAYPGTPITVVLGTDYKG